jgi:hypothetical protein
VERRVAKGQLFGSAGEKDDVVRSPGGAGVAHSLAQHRLVQVDADDTTLGPFGDRERHTGRTGRDVQDPRPGKRPRESVDHHAPPTAILPERQQQSQSVIASRQTCEHLARDVVAANSRLA